MLVGTQLAAKGLDLPSVTLAAVIAADVTLNLPDYLAPERTFQLLAQVAGRAGRGPLRGGSSSRRYAAGPLRHPCSGPLDVDGFADEELPRRRLLGYPPASVLARLLIADADRARAESAVARRPQRGAAPGVEVLVRAGVRAASRRSLADAGRPAGEDEARRAAALERCRRAWRSTWIRSRCSTDPGPQRRSHRYNAEHGHPPRS